MTIQELNCFLEVAKTLNYTKAAENLYIAQPTITRHIQLLEAELGVRLFDRTVKRTVELTPEGQMLAKCLRKCSAEYQKTLEAIQKSAQKLPSHFNIPWDLSFPKELYQGFHEIYVDYDSVVDIIIHFIRYNEIRDVLGRGEFCISATDAIPTNRKYASKIITKEPVPYYLILSASHEIFSKKDAPELSDFAGYPLFLQNSLPPKLAKRYIQYVSSAIGEEPSLLMLDSLETILLYMRSKTGMTISTAWFKNFNDPELRFIPLPRATHYAIYWDDAKPINPIMRNFINDFQKIPAPDFPDRKAPF